MGQKHPRTSQCATSKQNAFKLFEYQCPTCSSKRPIQYFYRNGTFLSQAPRVVCGECNTSVTVEPFKTVDYGCPSCKKWHKVRLPARPIPLNMYNVSVASCGCGFRGEVPVGRLMDVACGECWTRKRELRGVWTEDGDEVKTFCENCQDYRRSFARAPQKKGAEHQDADMEYTCENCFRVQPIHAEELLRSQGLAYCSLCGWVGYPEVTARSNAAGSVDKSKSQAGSSSSKKHADKARRPAEKVKARPARMEAIVPGAS